MIHSNAIHVLNTTTHLVELDCPDVVEMPQEGEETAS